MSFLSRLLLALCVFAGLANGMVHQSAHDSHDQCAAQHSHNHGDTQTSHEDDGDGDPKGTPHHHDCCNFPSAVSALDEEAAAIIFQHILVEISTDDSLIPDDPVFALNKPPLI